MRLLVGLDGKGAKDICPIFKVSPQYAGKAGTPEWPVVVGKNRKARVMVCAGSSASMADKMLWCPIYLP